MIYEDKAVQDCYEFACEWICDEETARAICDMVGAYGSDVFLMSDVEWYTKTPEQWEEEFTRCLIGEDVALEYFVVSYF
jgi:hypothetical protein